MTPASVNDTNYLKYCTIFSRHTKQKIKKVYADKGYAGKPNRNFLALNKIADGIMRKDSTTAKLTEYEKKRNKKISKVRILWSSTSVSVTCMTVQNEPGLPKPGKIISIAGIAKRTIISQEAKKILRIAIV